MNGDYTATIAVVDEDLGIEASDLITKLASEYKFKVNLISYEAALEQVKDRTAISAVIIHKSFYDLAEGIEIVQLRETVESGQLSRILESEIALILQSKTLSQKVEQVITDQGGNVDTLALSGDVKTVFLEHWQDKKPIQIKTELLDNSDAISLGLNLHYVAGMTLFFVTYSLMFTVGDILEDKRLHTLDRMLVSPATRMNMLTANLISAMIIGMIQITVMVLAGKFMFAIEWGRNLPLVLGIGFLYIFVVTAMSLFVVSLMKTMAQLGAVSPIVLTGMGMIGGCMWPLEIITSKPLLFLANLTPHKWALDAIKGAVIYGRVDQSTILSVVILLAMGIGYLVLGERVMYFKSLKEN